MQYVRCEVDEGKAYTYTWDDIVFALAPGDRVMLPGNEVQPAPFEGRVIRLLDGPDKNYDGPYKSVLGRA